MKVKTKETEKAVIINLEGEMMLGYEANDFHEAIQSSLGNNKKTIIVDLSEVKFISSWGIGILIYGYTTATNQGSNFKLAAVPENIMETLQKVKVDIIFQKYDSVEEALKD
ncbi:MAG: STAS domain-containing protein [Ignavibacteriales bacterium]|nr:STAS domain-containing protein [Ignavibacteriales bacterium]